METRKAICYEPYWSFAEYVRTYVGGFQDWQNAGTAGASVDGQNATSWADDTQLAQYGPDPPVTSGLSAKPVLPNRYFTLRTAPRIDDPTSRATLARYCHNPNTQDVYCISRWAEPDGEEGLETVPEKPEWDGVCFTHPLGNQGELCFGPSQIYVRRHQIHF